MTIVFLRTRQDDRDKEELQKVEDIRGSPLSVGTMEEMAAIFAFFGSEDSSYITGQTLYACGGLSLYPEFRTAWASE